MRFLLIILIFLSQLVYAKDSQEIDFARLLIDNDYDPISDSVGLTKEKKEHWLKENARNPNTNNFTKPLEKNTVKPVPYQPILNKKIEKELSECLAEAKVSPQANECNREATEKYIISMKSTGISINENLEQGLWKQFSTLYSDCEVGFPAEMDRSTNDESYIAGCRLAVTRYFYSLPKK